MSVKDIMLSAVRTQVCGGERVEYAGISDEELKRLYEVAKAQDLAHLVAAELDRQGLLRSGDEVSEKFRKQQILAVFRYERINYELEEICSLFEELEIPHIPLKGSALRTYYPEPWMRTSADIDILITKDNVDKAKSALVDRYGYTQGHSGTGYDLSFFAPSGVHLELHFNPLNDDQAANSSAVLKDIWVHATPKDGWAYRMVLDDAMFYLYHMAHMAKHFEESGCGARFFLDTWILCHGVEYDREERKMLLQAGGLWQFALAAERLSEVWFANAEHDEMSRNMEKYIFSGGIYGTLQHRIVTNRIRKGGKLSYTVSRIFPSYDLLKRYYPYLEGRKWLLPFYEVRRWLRIIFKGKLKRSVDELKFNANIDDEQKQDVEQMLKQLELV